MPIGTTKVYRYGAHCIITYMCIIIVCLLKPIHSSNSKIYLTVNQSALLIPQLYIDQTIYTEYLIQGTNLKIHQPLQTIHSYNILLSIAVSIHGQSLIRMKYYPPDLFVLYYVSTDWVLYYCVLKSGVVFQVLGSVALEGVGGLSGMEIGAQDWVMLWTERSLIVVQFREQQRMNSQQQHASPRYTSKVHKGDLPITLPSQLKTCHPFSHLQYICATAQTVLFFTQDQQQPQSQTLTLGRIMSVLNPSIILKCIVNVYRLDDQLIALCDCDAGCFNFAIEGNFLVETTRFEMIGNEKVLVMRVTESAPKMTSMAVAGDKILALLRWGQDKIDIDDSMLLPDIEDSQLWDIDISGNNICLKYKIVIQKIPTYKYIFIQYDQTRFDYDQLNILLSSSYLYPQYRVFYTLQNNGTLNLRVFNPYYLLVQYHSEDRSIKITAINKDANGTVISEEEQIVNIVAVALGGIYKGEELEELRKINYVYNYPLQIYQYFAGRISKFWYRQKQIPIDDIPESWTGQKYDKNFTINISQKRRIFSIYNLLQCVRLVDSGTYVFRRFMTSPQINKLYIEECKPQKAQQNTGDFICQIKEIAVKLINGSNRELWGNLLGEGNRWEIFDIGVGKNLFLEDNQMMMRLNQSENIRNMHNLNSKNIQRKITHLEIWYRIIKDAQNEQTQIQNKINHEISKLYEFIIVTKNNCLYLIANKESIKLIQDRYLVIASSSKNQNHSIRNKISLIVYDGIEQSQKSYVLQLNHKHQLIKEIQVINIECQFKHQNHHFLFYQVVVAYRINNNDYLAIFHVKLSKQKQKMGIMNDRRTRETIQIKLVNHYQINSNISKGSISYRFYSRYLYILNDAYIAKISMQTPVPTSTMNRISYECVLYNHSIQIKNLTRVIKVEKYMLLVFQNSYTILDLEGQLLELIIDQQRIDGENYSEHEQPEGSVSSSGIYDMIIFGSDTLLIGINNIIRTYDRNLKIFIGPYPIQLKQIQTLHYIELIAYPPQTQPPSGFQQSNYSSDWEGLIQLEGGTMQYMNLTVDYVTNEIQVRQIAIMVFDGLPYEAVNVLRNVPENLFTGPVEEYYTNDVFNQKINLLNHIEKIYGVQNHDYDSKNPRKGISQKYNDKWVKSQTRRYVQDFKYYMLLRHNINEQKNTKQLCIQKQQFIYCNLTHILIVGLGCNGNGSIIHEIEIRKYSNGDFAGKNINKPNKSYQSYFRLDNLPISFEEGVNQQNDGYAFVLYSKVSILFLFIDKSGQITKQVIELLQYFISEVSITHYNNTTSSHPESQPQKNYIIFLILIQKSPKHTPNKLAYINMNKNHTDLIFINNPLYGNIQYMAAHYGRLIYVYYVDSCFGGWGPRVEDDKLCRKRYICVNKVDVVIGGSEEAYCTNMEEVISQKYYLSDKQIQNYYKIIIVGNTTTRQSTTIRFLLLSKLSNAYHLDIKLSLLNNSADSLNNNPNTKANRNNVSYLFQIANCYASLSNYQAMNFIGIYLNQSSYDYFVIQYRQLDSQQGGFVQDDSSDTILAFYRYNDQFDCNLSCSYVSGWTPVNSSQIGNMLHIGDPQYYNISHQSLMFTTTQIFHLLKNLSLMLNYSSPPSKKYLIIYSRNPLIQNKFYSKLKYESDPSEKYFWFYCWIGFGIVFLVLVVLKVIGVLIDKGYVKWIRSLSDDDECGSPGVIVHFNSSGGMLTEDTSNKSLETS